MGGSKGALKLPDRLHQSTICPRTTGLHYAPATAQPRLDVHELPGVVLAAVAVLVDLARLADDGKQQ
eukprot:3971564-Pyramimonas_sp.AAC.1